MTHITARTVSAVRTKRFAGPGVAAGDSRAPRPLIASVARRSSPTSTTTGLTIQAGSDPNWYPKGVKITDAQLAAVPLEPHDFHGEWNYTLAAQTIPA